jgi:hypothetical protein|tara:strand:- start:72 stop:476 length:405 start_codon:yes stop_codon:yes gene_type:complete
MEDDFYATIKLKSGEEIFTKVSPCTEDTKTFLLLSNPITFSEVKVRSGMGYKLEPWLKTTKDDMFILDMDDVMTMSESKDIEMIMMYQSWLRESKDFTDSEDPAGIRQKINRRMGRIGNVQDTKEILERLFKES